MQDWVDFPSYKVTFDAGRRNVNTSCDHMVLAWFILVSNCFVLKNHSLLKHVGLALFA